MNYLKTILTILLSVMTIGGVASDLVFDLVVACDGSGDYSTIQAAINAAPQNATRPYLIFIKNGVYDELVDIPENKTFIHLIGQDVEKTIVRHMMHCGGKYSNDFEYSVKNPQS